MNSNFRQEIERLIKTVPTGKVTTYGDLASMAGHPGAARLVGGVAHYGDSKLPWHRIVNRSGGLASGYPGGREAQADLLAQEGVESRNYVVVGFDDLRWRFSDV